MLTYQNSFTTFIFNNFISHKPRQHQARPSSSLFSVPWKQCLSPSVRFCVSFCFLYFLYLFVFFLYCEISAHVFFLVTSVYLCVFLQSQCVELSGPKFILCVCVETSLHTFWFAVDHFNVYVLSGQDIWLLSVNVCLSVWSQNYNFVLKRPGGLFVSLV